MAESLTSLDNLTFTNRYQGILPKDPITGSARRQISAACYSEVKPTPVRAPQLVAHSQEVAELIGLDPDAYAGQSFVDVFSGNRTLPGMDPHATCYGGHQFGNWAGQLGDGRAINLGEIRNPAGEHWMLQLKGAGPTPYSRTADGLAVLRSSVREFVCSEAMYHLGVPTTRALSLLTTGEEVERDMLYNGNAAFEPGAVVCRVAPSFTRFGHFELLAARQEVDLLRVFLDHTIRQDFPHLVPAGNDQTPLPTDVHLSWFAEVCERTALVVAHWMRVGFVHGVMNTDNMSVLGLTIDYGPYGWLEDYDPDWTPNTTDAGQRRYRYGQQPGIAQWNLLQLANAVFPVIDDAPGLEDLLKSFPKVYDQHWHKMLAQKVGLADLQRSEDLALATELLDILTMRETDMTVFFRQLANVDCNISESQIELFTNAYYQLPGAEPGLTATNNADQQARLGAWLDSYTARLRQENLSQPERRASMNAVNPNYVFRNYLAQLAIDRAEAGDNAGVEQLLEVFRDPYSEKPEFNTYAVKRPDWARTRVGCSMLSCSS